VAYEKTHDLAIELRSVGCGDLDIEGSLSSKPSLCTETPMVFFSPKYMSP